MSLPKVASLVLIALLAVCGCAEPVSTSSDTSSESVSVEPVEVTSETFGELVLSSNKPVLLDCGATWCGPCRQLEPTIAELAGQFQGRAVVAKLDVDKSPEVASQLEISSIPAIFIFKDGQVQQKFVGVQSRQKLAAALEQQL